MIEGRAGTGKSFTLAAIRKAHERNGQEVIGLAPTNAVAQDLRNEGGFTRAATVHSELFRIKNGLAHWSRDSVVIVDEAAMLDTPVTGELMAQACRREADPRRRRSAARFHRTRWPLCRAQEAARVGGDHGGYAPTPGMAASGSA